MRRATVAATVVLMLAAPGRALADTRGPAAGWRSHHGGVVSDVKALIRRVEHRWHVPGRARKALSVARCESGFHPGADSGQYSGVYQIGDTEWRTWNRPNHYGRWFGARPGPHNARANVITALFHAGHRGIGWTAWSCA